MSLFALPHSGIIAVVYNINALRYSAYAAAIRPGLQIPKNNSLRLQVEDVHYRYGEGLSKALDGITLSIEPDECVVITGASGCGKSTLLKIMAGLIEPSKGRILIGDTEIKQVRLVNYRRQIVTVLRDD